MSALHVAFTDRLSGRLRDAAQARGLTPQVLVAGAIACMLDGDLLDAVFDGTDAHDAAGGHARHANGLTHLQCAILHLVGQKAGADGVCHLSAHRFALLCGGASVAGVQDATRRLLAAGLLAKAPKRMVGGVQPHRLTAAGASLAAALSGDVPNGWVESGVGSGQAEGGEGEG